MTLPEPQSSTFSSLINDIESGLIKIPQFQRDFVWSKAASSKLMDSILKGYPIGSFIFWKTKERLRSVKNIGNLNLPIPDEGDFVNFVLDGQQRLTSLFASIKGVQVLREKSYDDFSEIYLSLTNEESEQLVFSKSEDLEVGTYISLKDLLFGGLQLLTSYNQNYFGRIEEYKRRIESYQFSIITIKNAPIEVATDIFTRINEGGKSLSVFEIMVAKTYDESKNFDLQEEYERLIGSLSILDYETIPSSTVLQTVSILIEKECQRKTILNLDKALFIETWPFARDAIERAVEYMQSFYRIPVSQLLPYNAIIVPFAYYFSKQRDKPVDHRKYKLQDYFWRCSISGRFSSGVENKLANDIKRIDKIIDDELPVYDWSVDTTAKFIEKNGYFSAGRSYIKALLCLMAFRKPESFIDGSLVNISNSWLKQANSKNYHHFFPKAYLRRQGIDYSKVNHVANIVIVDDFLNKRKIRDKAPSIYMRDFQNENFNLNDTMKTHMINDLSDFGIWDDDYETFFNRRLDVLSQELTSRIIPNETDSVFVPRDIGEDLEEL